MFTRIITIINCLLPVCGKIALARHFVDRQDLHGCRNSQQFPSFPARDDKRLFADDEHFEIISLRLIGTAESCVVMRYARAKL